MNQEIWKLDALGQSRLIKKGEISARELVQATLERIEQLNPRLNAISSVYRKQALAAADASMGEGHFAGVPLVLKDLLPYPGMNNTMGSRLLAQNFVTEETPYSKSLVDAGFIALGKSATSEFGLLGSTETMLQGVTRNPWNPEYSAAGSSGGAAAAVAGGMLPIAHATDGGGSIRIPASVNGLFGLKPSAGRTLMSGPMTGDFLNLVSDHCVSKSVRDSAAFLDVTERKDAGANLAPIGFVERPLERAVKIGFYSTTLVGSEPDVEIRAALERTAALCSDIGHEVVEVKAPPVSGRDISDAFFILAGAAMSDMASFMKGMLGREPDGEFLEPFTLALIQWYRALPEGELSRARDIIAASGRAMLAYAEPFDVLLSPVLGMGTPELGFLSPKLEREELIRRTERFAGYTPVHNMTGMCAMSVPLHVTANGLPMGSHFAAAPGQEALLLGLAYQLEEAAPWAERFPEPALAVR